MLAKPRKHGIDALDYGWQNDGGHETLVVCCPNLEHLLFARSPIMRAHGFIRGLGNRHRGLRHVDSRFGQHWG
jgi:hypothetical protein